MEPDTVPLHPSTPPSLDVDWELDKEFGNFGGFSAGPSCSPPGFADSVKPAATHKTNCGFNQLVEHFQPTSTVNSGSGTGQMILVGRESNAESCVHLTNGYSEKGHNSRTHNAVSPRKEVDFADFTMFTGQPQHPWCCGFTPLSSADQCDVRAERKDCSNDSSERICGQEEAILYSEPRSRNYAAKHVCTTKHCEKRDVALVQPSEDHHQEDSAAPLDCPSRDEDLGESSRERRHSSSSLQIEVQDDRGSQEKSLSIAPQLFRAYDSVLEDMASFCDDLSLECPSADLEPNVSSLASQGDQTDWDPTDDEEMDELGTCRHFDSLASLRRSAAERCYLYCDQAATQETTATTSNPSPPIGILAEDTFSDFEECHSEHHWDQRCVQTAVQILGKLPPSDSFADFCSAPMKEDEEERWAEFKEDKEGGETWPLREQVSNMQQPEESSEEEREGSGKHGVSRWSSQVTLCCRVQQLLLASFPEVVFPDVEGEEEQVLGLGAAFDGQHLPGSEQEWQEMPELSPRPQWIHKGIFRPHLDIHSAIGLRFQWGGSHSNSSLLRCLGVDTRNIVLIGIKKQPVAVPAFASSLGMLEPTKDSIPAVCSPVHTSGTSQAPQKPRDSPEPPTHVMQEAPPSRHLGWSSRGLSSSQYGTSPRRVPHFWGWK